jgi:hypothetical protein
MSKSTYFKLKLTEIDDVINQLKDVIKYKTYTFFTIINNLIF